MNQNAILIIHQELIYSTNEEKVQCQKRSKEKPRVHKSFEKLTSNKALQLEAHHYII